MVEYPKDFVKAVNDLIDNWEGGYTDDPHDPGGETNMGISHRSYPMLNIKSLTRDEAIKIYYRDFWAAPKLEVLFSDPQLRAKVFNMGVLIGPVAARKLAVGCNNITQYRLVCKRHFEALVISHPMLRRYLKGWVRRAMA